ncbi:MAG: sugar ABC transporter ATP-binding protein, partial [Christensenellaceae bacterium]|nr:sugar ABC transporter ATP-binding protein [Christensenellaceae bacterium]
MSTLRAERIVKDYPGTRALDDVSISFDGGKVHAFIGKNGSGKSTLVKVFSGAIQPSGGKFFLDDREMCFNSPIDAREQGIATVYQELSLVPYLSVAENIYLGRLPKRGRVIDWKQTFSRADELLKRMDVDIDPREKVYKLSMWQCQIVEIVKAMSFSPKVLMLDEPTSALAQHETQSLFKVVRTLRDQGVIIIYISHRLQEIWEIADTVTVLRDGRLVGVEQVANIDHKSLIGMMFGDVEIRKRPADLPVQDKTVLEVRGLTRANRFEGVSFALRRGEVLGIAGMLGAGRTELLRSIFGADPFDSGEIIVKGKRVGPRISPITMKRCGLGLTPEERKTQGIILIHSIRDNLCYASLDQLSDSHVVNQVRRDQFAERQVADLDIKVPTIMAAAGSLSGGNQQKVVIGNWLN